MRRFLPLVGILFVLVSHSYAQQSRTDTISTAAQSAVQNLAATINSAGSDDPSDPIRSMQLDAVKHKRADWGRWGIDPSKYSSWINHSNRLIPVYTFGITLDRWREEGSVYRDPQRLEQLYGAVPKGTVNPTAVYYDQCDIYQLQLDALAAGYTNIILMVFDGMDWQTTRAAALYKNREMYTSGRGTGLSIQDDRRAITDFAFVCTSPRLGSVKFDVNSQIVIDHGANPSGGYDIRRAGEAPWHEQSRRPYLLGLEADQPHSFTDSASSASSMTTGIKTYNGAINVGIDGSHLVPLGRVLQAEQEFKVGIVTNVPVSHATPAGAYANNVTRKDYQDIARDLIGLPSVSHRTTPLSGVDVLIGGGWGEHRETDQAQGENFLPGNKYLHEDDIQRVDIRNGGRYVVAERKQGTSGRQRLMSAAQRAADQDHRLLGYFGTKKGHLPYQTADGQYNPTLDVAGAEQYTQADINENPTLADMTRAALAVLERSIEGFWLMVEAGDVDWANHSNNLDNSIGAVLSGDDAFRVIMDWVDENNAWSYTAVIVTADHGHFLVIEDAQAIIQAGNRAAAANGSP